MNPILGFVLIAGVLSFVLTIFRDIGLSMIFNPDAFLIVFGGTVVALVVGFPLKRIHETSHEVIDTFRDTPDREEVIKEIVQIAKSYRRADIRGLEDRMRHMKDNFLKLGINLLINHYKSADIKNIMEREMALRVIHYNFSQNMLKTIARLTPSFGLAGTVISLIKMFKNLQSFDAIAPLMAVALMSTFYGVIISNLIMLPLCAKLKDRAIVSETLMGIITEGIVATNNMNHPLKIEEQIGGYQNIGEDSLSGVETTLAFNKGV